VTVGRSSPRQPTRPARAPLMVVEPGASYGTPGIGSGWRRSPKRVKDVLSQSTPQPRLDTRNGMKTSVLYWRRSRSYPLMSIRPCWCCPSPNSDSPASGSHSWCTWLVASPSTVAGASARARSASRGRPSRSKNDTAPVPLATRTASAAVASVASPAAPSSRRHRSPAQRRGAVASVARAKNAAAVAAGANATRTMRAPHVSSINRPPATSKNARSPRASAAASPSDSAGAGDGALATSLRCRSGRWLHAAHPATRSTSRRGMAACYRRRRLLPDPRLKGS
jgi:hypothetical protein